LMMSACLRTAGCPAAERDTRTEPTAGAKVAPEGVTSPRPRCPREGGRAVHLRRRRLERDDFLGVKGDLHSRCSARSNGRPSVDVWCNPFTRLTPVWRRIRRHPFAERQAATLGRDNNWKKQFASGVRPLDFRGHVEARR
jgi:hypothetical protein